MPLTKRALINENRVDFAHIQKLFLEVLDHKEAGPTVQQSVRYVMVDEYQDTNYIQERVLERLSEPQGNLCIVGDEDQALYRWRGATVRNILEFPTIRPGATVIKMTTNYRSHEAIVVAYNKFMADLEARFVPDAGMIGVSLTDSGIQLLGQRRGLDAYVADGKTMGIPILYP
jgi:DNA helicase II / ATP-dependent DNA helicase PcrA